MSRLFATSIFSNTLSVSARVHAKRTTNHCFMFSSQSSQLRCVVGTDRVSCATSSQKERRTVTVRGRTACLAFFCSASSSQGVERSTSTSSSTQTSDEEDEYERKKNSGQMIRKRFLNFYERKGHKILQSASLVPEDPTVLLTIAGMLQFKPVFMGQKEREVARATTSQKCVRTNDIENVGVTARHHTFFEMLGNFSFGDYFKKEACEWAWELSTKELLIDPGRIWVSVFESDDEAFTIWRDVVGVPEKRILRMGAEDNFWAAGPTGPCGPCSELYYDFKPELGMDNVSDLNDDSRFVEFYNLVFMELSRDVDGKTTPLKNKNIDTGMGLERVAQILQKKPNNYETDLMMPIIAKACEMADLKYEECDEKQKRMLKVAADHIRAVTYLISDGVFPSNVGRGYIVRRLIRRVVRSGRLLGMKEKGDSKVFTTAIAKVAIELSKECDPNVMKRSEKIYAELEREELGFKKTLQNGEALLADIITRAKKDNNGVTGAEAFLLYDTFGFPLDITTDVAGDNNVSVDVEGFETEMEKARNLARSAAKTVDVTTGDALARVADELKNDVHSKFVGYDSLLCEKSLVLAIVSPKTGEMLDRAVEGDEVDIVLSQTPFYAESGGQIADIGIMVIENSNTVVHVIDVQKAAGGRIISHRVKIESGIIEAKTSVLETKVDKESRRRARANHTATHLLQSALKQVMGDDVSQAGSLVSFDRLRFDFNSSRAPNAKELERIEILVNEWIFDATSLEVAEMPIAAAKAKGATMMFGEKYGDIVRVVDVPNVSMELCGGTHVSNTSEICGFKILSESGIASGVRRIEACAGPAVIDLVNKNALVVNSLSQSLKVKPEEISDRVKSLQKDLLEQQKLAEKLKGEIAVAKASSLKSLAEQHPTAKTNVLIAKMDEFVSPDALNVACQSLLQHLGPDAIVLLASTTEDFQKVTIVCAVGDEAVKKGLNAGKICGACAKACGGGGGGKPNFAQAGGRDGANLPNVLLDAKSMVFESLH